MYSEISKVLKAGKVCATEASIFQCLLTRQTAITTLKQLATVNFPLCRLSMDRNACFQEKWPRETGNGHTIFKLAFAKPGVPVSPSGEASCD